MAEEEVLQDNPQEVKPELFSDILDIEVDGNEEFNPDPTSRYFQNLAVNLSDEESKSLSEICIRAYEIDEESRSEWVRRYENWLRLIVCKPLQEKKTEPFDGASNVLMPVLTIACTQFWARAIDAIYPTSNIVKGVPIDDLEENVERALRVGKHMSYQILHTMPNFYEGMASSMMQLPMSGTVIRKTYRDTVNNVNVSEFVNPNDLVVNYYTRYLNQAKCITHKLNESYNDMVIKQNAGLYSGVDKVSNCSTQDNTLSPSASSEVEERQDINSGIQKPSEDIYKMRRVLEIHIVLPIFNDEGECILNKAGGVARRFIVTIDYESRQVLRIVDPTYIDEESGKRVDANFFTKYGFIPSPDGSFYNMGFGMLLEATNETINTIINQLIDAGHLANTQNGVVLKKSGLKRGMLRLRRGEFAEVDLNTDDIRKAIMPINFKEPSQVLYQLLGLLQDYANRVTTVSDIFTGEMPRSDTAATAVTTTVEQGLKVFSAIYRGLHISFGEELRKVFILNSIYVDEEEYFDVNENEENKEFIEMAPKWKKLKIATEDYRNVRDVLPASDPNAVSKTERIQKAQIVYQTSLQNPLISQNPTSIIKVTEDYLTTILENTSKVKSIIDPIKVQVQQFQQQQMQQQQMMELNEQKMQMEAQAMGMYNREMQEGIVPEELIQSAIQRSQNEGGEGDNRTKN